VGDPTPTIGGFAFVGVSPDGRPEYDKTLGDGVKMRFVLVPAGKLDVGKPTEPQHPVSLQAFLIAKTECTQEQWRAVTGDSPSHFNGDLYPVEKVSWDDIQEFERETGLGLPSEAQWEYAARAGDTDEAPDDVDAVAWYAGNSSNHTQPVGGKAANAFGLHDMLGNVAEWCEDTWHDRFSGDTPRDGSPWIDSGNQRRVRRGKSWGDGRAGLRYWRREGSGQHARYRKVGFRLVHPSW